MNGATKQPIAIGIDAGGTKTTAWLVEVASIGRAPQPIAPRFAVTTGCGNVRAAGFEPAFEQIARAIEGVLSQADVSSSDGVACSLCLAAAGAGRPDERKQLGERLRRRFPAASVNVTDDAEPVLAAASSDRVGVALIAGTGSLAWGRDRVGDVQRCGGWGYLFGDEGSGYAIGIAALRAAARSADGRGPTTQLLPVLCEHFQIDRPEGLVEAVYGKTLSRQAIARLSEWVFGVADRDDVADTIVDRAAEDLAGMVNTLAGKLRFDVSGPPPPPVLALAGGLLTHSNRLSERVIRRITFPFADVQRVPEPVAGAVRLAVQSTR